MDEYKEIFESWGGPDCPMEATVELIGRKWVIALIRDMYVGKKLMHGQKFGKIYIILYILNTYSNYP